MAKKCILCENERFLIKTSYEELYGTITEQQVYSFFCYDCIFNKPFPTIKEHIFSFCPTCQTADGCDQNCKLLKAQKSEPEPECKIIHYKKI